jgi:glycosyltransferase involved in cell wall biosynthesis
VHILKVSQTYFPFQAAGGPPTKIRAIAKRLVHDGHTVTILTADMGFGKPGGPPEPTERNQWGWRAEESGIEVVYLRTWVHYRALTVNPGVIRYCKELLGSFDIVHIYGLYDLLGLCAGSRCLRRGIPYVIEPIGMFRPIIRSLWLKRAYHLLLGGKQLVQRASSVVATSEQEKQELVAGGIAESLVIVRRNGVDVPEHLPQPGSFRTKLNLAADVKLILFLGRLIAKKSPDLLIRAYAMWWQDAAPGNSSALVLGGPDEGDGFLKKLKSLSRELGLGETVKFTGPLYDQAKWEAYRDADVFVLPSQNENFGNTIAEAVACGTPVIVTDRCGIAQAVNGRAGLMVPYGSNEIKAALTKILNEDSPRQRYQRGCEEVAKELSWNQPVAQMEALYSTLISEAGGR